MLYSIQGKMKKISLKIINLAFGILLLLSTIISATPSIQPNQESIISSKNNHFDLINIDPKIETILETIDENLLRGYLETLVGYAPRYTGTFGCVKSAEYIYQQFEEMGLDTRYQNWTAFGNRHHPHIFNSQNVEGRHLGIQSDKIVIFNAHYDTVRNTPGADDNGGGTAAVLAAAYALSQFSFQHTIKFVTFSGEEMGLLGSHAYAKECYENNDNIIVDLNADMIAYTETPEGGKKFRMYGTPDVEWIMDSIEIINTDYGIDFNFIRDTLNEEAERGGSDYFSFIEYGYEAVAFFEAGWNQHMHSPEDNLDNINFSYLVNTTRLIAATMAYLADLDIPNPQVRIESPKQGKLYYEGLEKREIADLKTIVIDGIWIWADDIPGDVSIVSAEFYYDDILEYVDTEPPFKWHFNKLSVRKHKVTVIVYDEVGRTASAFKYIRFINLFKNR